MNPADYQLVIIGGGPAGLTAGIYAARARLKAVLLENGAVAGQVLTTDWVDNYPGFPDGISGFELIDRMTAQAARFGLETRQAQVTGLDIALPIKKVHLESGETITSRALIIATGARPNQLGVPGEKELTGKGVSYCATCDGPFYRDQEIAVVGGGDTAVQEAEHLTKFASRVTVVHRRAQLRATQIIQEKAFANPKIHFLWNTQVKGIEGTAGVQRLHLQTNDGQEGSLAVTGVFVLIGTTPNNDFLPLEQLGSDKHGFVLTDGEMRTKIPGIMAAGDIRSKNVRQIVNGAGEGAVAVLAAVDYLNDFE
ncbi:MAG: thioredoxin-disulfide reductase [Deltaproteobacteria bacterium RIFOXYD12_FULL_57_12]|nr:MAG: thioredoxin-disulfide reductase [Deltaproteobacteria bacterium RIFOXYD12_FULL_57_12]